MAKPYLRVDRFTGGSSGNDLFTFAGTNEIRYSLPQKRMFGVRARYNF